MKNQYIPNYKRMNIKPKEMPVASADTPGQFVVSQGSRANPRERAVPQVKMPFADVVINNFPIGSGPMPNVGNNIEQTWSGVDSDIVDDIGLDPNQEMIDNNDEVYIDEPTLSQRKISAAFEQQYQEDLSTFKEIDDSSDQYYLMIKGEFYTSGSLEEIQKEVTDLLYEQHSLSKHVKITLDDIVVFKKMNIKFGVFISEE